MNLVLKKEKIYFRENWLKFFGIWGAAELFWGFGEHKQNTFRELRQKLTGIWGDQSIIFRELGSKDPPWGGLILLVLVFYQLHAPCQSGKGSVGRLSDSGSMDSVQNISQVSWLHLEF